MKMVIGDGTGRSTRPPIKAVDHEGMLRMEE